VIPLISASWVARIADGSNLHRAFTFLCCYYEWGSSQLLIFYVNFISCDFTELLFEWVLLLIVWGFLYILLYHLQTKTVYFTHPYLGSYWLASISNVMLNSSRNSGHPCLIHDFCGNISNVFP
jgi:hypothetical protein